MCFVSKITFYAFWGKTINSNFQFSAQCIACDTDCACGHCACGHCAFCKVPRQKFMWNFPFCRKLFNNLPQIFQHFTSASDENISFKLLRAQFSSEKRQKKIEAEIMHKAIWWIIFIGLSWISPTQLQTRYALNIDDLLNLNPTSVNQSEGQMWRKHRISPGHFLTPWLDLSVINWSAKSCYFHL